MSGSVNGDPVGVSDSIGVGSILIQTTGTNYGQLHNYYRYNTVILMNFLSIMVIMNDIMKCSCSKFRYEGGML